MYLYFIGIHFYEVGISKHMCIHTLKAVITDLWYRFFYWGLPSSMKGESKSLSRTVVKFGCNSYNLLLQFPFFSSRDSTFCSQKQWIQQDIFLTLNNLHPLLVIHISLAKDASNPTQRSLPATASWAKVERYYRSPSAAHQPWARNPSPWSQTFLLYWL